MFDKSTNNNMWLYYYPSTNILKSFPQLHASPMWSSVGYVVHFQRNNIPQKPSAFVSEFPNQHKVRQLVYFPPYLNLPSQENLKQRLKESKEEWKWSQEITRIKIPGVLLYPSKKMVLIHVHDKIFLRLDIFLTTILGSVNMKFTSKELI